MDVLEPPGRPILRVDPWHGSSGPLPDDAQFVCAYDVDVGIDCLLEAAFLVHRETDELWIIRDPPLDLIQAHAAGMGSSDIDAMLAVVARHQPDGLRAAEVMLDALFEAGLGFCWPTRHLIGGIIDRETFVRIVAKLEARIDARKGAARSYGNARIVLTAKECQLDPRPSGTHPSAWMANCPETNHWLMIGADSNTWDCGWCKRRGGPDELRAFVMERTANGFHER
jgi:hypothetical protein